MRLISLVGALTITACPGPTVEDRGSADAAASDTHAPDSGVVDTVVSSDSGVGADTLSPDTIVADTAPGLDTATSAEDTVVASSIGDFSLVDLNPTSATFEQPVSPRDYLEKVSGWYFGHAT